jgi:hypothetical protein
LRRAAVICAAHRGVFAHRSQRGCDRAAPSSDVAANPPRPLRIANPEIDRDVTGPRGDDDIKEGDAGEYDPQDAVGSQTGRRSRATRNRQLSARRVCSTLLEDRASAFVVV